MRNGSKAVGERRDRETPSRPPADLDLPGSEEELLAALAGVCAHTASPHHSLGLRSQRYRITVHDLNIIYGQHCRQDMLQEWARLRRLARVPDKDFWIPLLMKAADAHELSVPCCSCERFAPSQSRSRVPVAVVPIHPKFRQDLAWRTALGEECGARRKKAVEVREPGQIRWEPRHVRALRRVQTLPTSAEDNSSLLKWSLCATCPAQLTPWPFPVESCALEHYSTPPHKRSVKDRREWMRHVRAWVRRDETWVRLLEWFARQYVFEVPRDLAREWPELLEKNNVELI